MRNLIAPRVELEGRYRIERTLDRGGSSTVYLATDLVNERPVAVKAIWIEASSPQRRQALLKQFRLEASLLLTLDHPGLPKVYDSFEKGDQCYLVMDYIEGRNLSQRVRRDGVLESVEVARIGREVATVLDYLHSQNPAVVLRDLKPSNIMMTDSGQIKVIDFGVAKLHDPEQSLQTLTSARGMLTPGFAAPEQYRHG